LQPTGAYNLTVDFSGVTEATGNQIALEALSMLYTRYRFAASFCAGKDVLEVACGGGAGLGYLAKTARSVIGGDYTNQLARQVRNHYQEKLPVVRFDAEALPFRDNSFDVLVLYEALYYLPHPNRFLEESLRVLRKPSCLLICTANKDLDGFNPSPFSNGYLSAPQLCNFLEKYGFTVELRAAFPAKITSTKGRLVTLVKQAAIRLGLMPKTMKGKALLKRLFIGPLVSVPSEIQEDLASYYQPEPISSSNPETQYKVLYAIGHLSK